MSATEVALRDQRPAQQRQKPADARMTSRSIRERRIILSNLLCQTLAKPQP
jgi:hypothetical protein